MSEPMFPSGQPDVPVAAAVEPPAKSRRGLFIAGGVLAGLALGAGAFFLLSSGGGGDEGGAVAAAPRAAAPAPAASAAAAKPKPVIKTITMTTRDPFAVLFPAPAPTVSAAPAAATTSTTSGSTTSTTPVPTVKQVVSVSAINLAKNTATVTVDGVKYPVAVGKTFAKSFLMYSVFNSTCVGLLYGDQNVAVCTAKPVSVGA